MKSESAASFMERSGVTGDAVSRCAALLTAKAVVRGVAGNSPLEWGAGDFFSSRVGKVVSP